MNKTKIQWTDYTSNPILCRRKSDGKVGWGCVKISPGCANCYASTWNGRNLPARGTGLEFTAHNLDQVEFFLDEGELRKLATSKAISGKRVFLEDMSDLFGHWVKANWLDALWSMMALRSDVTFQILTKRSNRMTEYAQSTPVLPNVWLGVSVENQAMADARIPDLLRTPAAVRFLSCEPLLGPIDLAPWLPGDVPDNYNSATDREVIGCHETDLEISMWKEHVDWVIIGGESGPHARPCEVGWTRSLVRQCREAGVPTFVKQLGSNPMDETRKLGLAPGVASSQFNVRWNLKDSKGGELSEWPEDLRVREFPTLPHEVPK